MKANEWFLCREDDAWYAGQTDGGEVELYRIELDGEDEAETERLAAMMKEHGYDGRAVCLGLPSELVFCAEIDAARLPRRAKRQAMLYRLEEHLPLDAEDITADFIATGTGRALGAAVRTKPVAELIDSLTQAGLEVGTVRPTALLALWQAMHSSEPGQQACFAVVAEPSSVNLFRLSGDSPAAWYTAGTAAKQLRQYIRAELLARPVPQPVEWLLVGEPPEEALAVLEEEFGCPPWRASSKPPVETAAVAAHAALRDGRPGWVELRRDALSEGNPWARFGAAVKTIAVLAVLLPAVLSASLLWRSHRYDAMEAEHRANQQRLFTGLYPNQPIPLDVPSRLASEHRRLAGISGSDVDVPSRPCALAALQQVVAHLPGDIRLRVEQVRIDPDVVLINGQARNHGDAERICQGLRQSGFQVGSPRTEALVAGGISFTITATRSEPAGLAAAGRAGM